MSSLKTPSQKSNTNSPKSPAVNLAHLPDDHDTLAPIIGREPCFCMLCSTLYNPDATIPDRARALATHNQFYWELWFRTIKSTYPGITLNKSPDAPRRMKERISELTKECTTPPGVLTPLSIFCNEYADSWAPLHKVRYENHLAKLAGREPPNTFNNLVASDTFWPNLPETPTIVSERRIVGVSSSSKDTRATKRARKVF